MAKTGVTICHETLREFRLRAGLSQADAAKRAGVSAWTWRQWEIGEARPVANRLETIARVLGCEPSSLVASVPVTLAEWRLAAGLTQADVAAELGLSRPSVAGWEQGRVPVPPRYRGRLLQVLGVPPSADVFWHRSPVARVQPAADARPGGDTATVETANPFSVTVGDGPQATVRLQFVVSGRLPMASRHAFVQAVGRSFHAEGFTASDSPWSYAAAPSVDRTEWTCVASNGLKGVTVQSPIRLVDDRFWADINTVYEIIKRHGGTVGVSSVCELAVMIPDSGRYETLRAVLGAPRTRPVTDPPSYKLVAGGSVGTVTLPDDGLLVLAMNPQPANVTVLELHGRVLLTAVGYPPG